MATYQELRTRSQQVRDEQNIGGNTALRVGQLLMDIVKYFYDNDAAASEYLQQHFAMVNDGTHLLNWQQSPIVILHTMGETYDEGDFSSLSQGENYYRNGFIVEANGQGGGINGETPKVNVLYVNLANDTLYTWNGASFDAITSGGGGSISGDDILKNAYYLNGNLVLVFDTENGDKTVSIPVNFDASNYVPTSRTVNGKRLNQNITIGIEDIPGLADAINNAGGGETIVINSDGANIVDEHDNNSVLFAPSARQMKLMYNNIMAIYNGLANIAFKDGKPTLDWVGSKTKYTLSYGTLTGCTADVAAGQVNEGALRIKLTPTQASYAFTSVTVNGESVATTATGDADGSVYLDIVVNGNITVAATAISGRGITFNGTGCSIRDAGVAIGQDLDTVITANEHFTLPSSITVKIGNANITHTYVRTQGNKTATLHIDAANITGDLTITCTANEEAHAIINLTGASSGVIVSHTNLAHVYVGDIITILPASGNKVTASVTVGGNAIMLNGNTYDGYTYTVGSGDVSNNGTAISIMAAGSALGTFNIDLTGVTSDVGVTWNTPSAAAQTILEGSPFSVTLAKVSGTGVLNISTSTMGSETIQPVSGTIATNHVTGNITIAASVAADQMKVHSWNLERQVGSVDNRPRYLEDDVAGQFRLYNKSDITTNDADNGWTAPGWSPSGGSYSGIFANGISNSFRAGYGNRTIDIPSDSDFTVAMMGVIPAPANASNAYGSQQPMLKFYDNSSNDGAAVTHNGGTQYIPMQFLLQISPTSTFGNILYPYIEYPNSGIQKSVIGTSKGVPVQIPSGQVYNVFFSYTKSTGEMKAYIAVESSGTVTVTLAGTLTTVPTLQIQCLQIAPANAGTYVTKDYLKKVELYNYAMDQTDVENVFS